VTYGNDPLRGSLMNIQDPEEERKAHRRGCSCKECKSRKKYGKDPDEGNED
jgi:hypothetical protein